MTPRFTVSIVCYTAIRQAKACVASVLQSTVPFRLILTANGSVAAADYFREVAAEFPFVTVNVNATNEGYIEPQKKAFSQCETELFVMLNDDTVVPPDFLVKLAAPFDIFPRAALSGAKGGCQSLLPNFHGIPGKGFEYLNGACLCCKAEIMRKHGLVDPNLKFAYGDDSDLSLRMRELDYTLHYADLVIRHEIGATSKHIKDTRVFVEQNHLYLRRRWGHYLTHRKMNFPILVRRTGAWGDVLLTTPIIRALRAQKPLSPLYVETACSEIYRGNPNVVQAARQIPRTRDMMIINLDGSYEATPGRHIVASYAERAGVTVDNYHTQIFPSPNDLASAAKMVETGDRWIAIHPGPSTWKGKDWPAERFSAVVGGLQRDGYKVVLVGSTGRNVACDVDARGRASLQGTAEIIRHCRLFIGLDSFPMHLAESVGTRAIGLFGVTDPQFISTRPPYDLHVCASVESFGLRHRVAGRNEVNDEGKAMDSITVDMVLAAANHALEPIAAFP